MRHLLLPYSFTAVIYVQSSSLRWQVLVELAELQDREVGDGTTSVVIVAAEFLKVTASIYLEVLYMYKKNTHLGAMLLFKNVSTIER